MRKITNSTAKNCDKRNQGKRSSLPYIAFLTSLFVAVISLKILTKDKTGNQSPTLPAPDLSEVDSMIIKAIKVAEQRVKGSPSNARFWGELGITYWVNKLNEPGRKCIQKAQDGYLRSRAKGSSSGVGATVGLYGTATALATLWQECGCGGGVRP